MLSHGGPCGGLPYECGNENNENNNNCWPRPTIHGGKKAHASRCGNCRGCMRGDCGECKNCLDKPKFGGRGIKKQACLRRACCNPQEEQEEHDESPGSPPSR